MRIDPFPAETFDLGLTRDGKAVTLKPMTTAAAAALGAETATFAPWSRYGFSTDAMTRSFAPAIDNGARYTAQVDGVLAGAIVLRAARRRPTVTSRSCEHATTQSIAAL